MMYTSLFRMVAKPGKRQEVMEHARWTVEVCKSEEPGTLRFDVYLDPNDENAFYVYEAFENEAAHEAHRQNAPFKRWHSERSEALIHSYENILEGAQVVASTAQ
jgi:autoinducer 2-degrading protein